MSQDDWLSHLLQMITVTGRLDVRCEYGTPWRVASAQAATREIPYHVVVKGRAVIADPKTGWVRELLGGDIVLLPHGSAHVLHDGSGDTPGPVRSRLASAGWAFSRNDGGGEQLELLCGRLFVESPHDRLIRNLLPAALVVRAVDGGAEKSSAETGGAEEGFADKGSVEVGSMPASNRLASLVGLMQTESAADKPGGHAIINALGVALFTLALRAASKADQAAPGLLALAGYPRLAPAVSAMFTDPARLWNVSDLADLCGMSRSTFMRHFEDKLGYTAIELLADIRISMAANELKDPSIATKAVADSVGYRSVSAFRRAFTDKVGMAPGEWRRSAREGE